MASRLQSQSASLAVAEDMVYAPLAAEDLNEMAARRIAEAIGLGLLEVGDRLPPETELAARFGIAPMTVREALGLLREAGYIETRRGRGGGTFIRSVLPLPSSGQKTPERQSLADIRDIADVREAVESATAGLAAKRASSEQIGELHELVEAMAAETDYEAFRRLDSRFHITLAVVGGSRRLTELVTRVQAEMRDLLIYWPSPEEALGITNGQHRAILAAVAHGDAETARARMVAHVRVTTEYMIQALLSDGADQGEGLKH
jgi:GntR family transcriptional repressor for pyruvate dehydrogenase complex